MAGTEYVGVINALKALQSGREDAYEGKQLGYGPQSHDLRDCAELKVPVVPEFTPGGFPRGPSHRLIYREFDPLPTVRDGRVVHDPNARPYRHVVAFGHRSHDPAAIAGRRLGRERGKPERDLHGVSGGGRPSVGKDLRGRQTTPHRIPVPSDLIRQAAILRDSPPAGSRGTDRTGQGEAPPDGGPKPADPSPGNVDAVSGTLRSLTVDISAEISRKCLPSIPSPDRGRPCSPGVRSQPPRPATPVQREARRPVLRSRTPWRRA
jgi:hypothetical protein